MASGVAEEGFVGDRLPDSPRAHARVRCAGTTQAGERCRGKAIPGSEFCFYHDPESELSEAGREGGVTSGARRSVRERFREDAERCYETLFTKLIEAVESEITRWGDCPNCRHKVPVTFADMRARTQAIQVLLDQGYGRPKETVEVGVSSEEERRQQLRAEVMKMTPEERKAWHVGAVAVLIAGMLYDQSGHIRHQERDKEDLRRRLAAITREQQEQIREVLRVTARRELELIEAGEPLALPASTSA